MSGEAERKQLKTKNAQRVTEKKEDTIASKQIEPEKYIVVRNGIEYEDGGFGVQFVSFGRQREGVDESRLSREKLLENREKVVYNKNVVSNDYANDFTKFEKVENSIEWYTEEERKKDEERNRIENEERIIRRKRGAWLRGVSDEKPEGW